MAMIDKVLPSCGYYKAVMCLRKTVFRATNTDSIVEATQTIRPEFTYNSRRQVCRSDHSVGILTTWRCLSKVICTILNFKLVALRGIWSI